MTTHSKLIYALKDGNIVSIDEVQSGKDCGCVCPACGDELIARKGQKRMHHFAHRSNEDCEYGYESSLHLAAKDILSRSEKMVIPPIYVEFPQSGKSKELLYLKKEIPVDRVELEKRFDDIIPDIIVYSGDKYFFIEIYVSHPIDDEKLKKLKEKNISAIEIDLSKIKGDISVEELSDILLKSSDRKSWKYNAVSGKWYQRFVKASDKMPLTQRGLALHVDGCPIGIRNWKGKNYANFVDDCTGCEYCISYTHEGYILCSGRERIATRKDFFISKEERISNSNNPLPKIEKCPNCKVQLVRAKKDKRDVWQCPRCTFYIPVGFNSGEN